MKKIRKAKWEDDFLFFFPPFFVIKKKKVSLCFIKPPWLKTHVLLNYKLGDCSYIIMCIFCKSFISRYLKHTGAKMQIFVRDIRPTLFFVCLFFVFFFQNVDNFLSK